MTKKALMAGVLGIAAAFAVSPAIAQQTGWYVGASVGQADHDADCDGAATCDTKDTAWRILGGYQINQNFAAELGYHDLGRARAAEPGLGELTARTNVWELVGVARLPLANQFSIYGKLGLYRGETKLGGNILGIPVSEKETNTDLTFGLGAQYDLTRQFGIRAEWQRYSDLAGDNIDKFDIDTISIGVVFRF
jgi:OmpA-OmpF porin, OOP family